MLDGLTYFDISDLDNSEGYTYGDYKFSFCTPMNITDPDDSDSYKLVYAYKDNLITDVIYADADYTASDIEAESDDDGTRHIKFTFETNTTCEEDDDEVYSTTFEIYCNSSGSSGDSFWDFEVDVDDDECEMYVKGTHYAGCAVF
jgi:hypothetical protein